MVEQRKLQLAFNFGPLAQLVEQQTLNLWVVGSKPTWLRFNVNEAETAK